MSADALTCQELVELVTEYLEGGLGVGERARFEEHVAACPPCQAHLDQLRRTIEVVGLLREEALTPAAEADLRSAFRAWKQGSGTAV
jgi:anti-sigma factor RsiW